MIVLLKPLPVNPTVDIAYGHRADAELRCYGSLGLFPSKRPDFQNISFGQFGHAMARAAIGCSMRKLVSFVLLSRFPRQMPFGATAKMTPAARVRCLMLRCWGRTVSIIASDTMNKAPPRAHIHYTVAMRVSCIRPYQAFIAVIGENNLAHVTLGFPLLDSAAKRVAMSTPTFPMCDTQASPVMRLVAIRNRAYRFCSHLRSFRDRLWSGLDQVLTHRSGPIFMPEKSDAYNYGSA